MENVRSSLQKVRIITTNKTLDINDQTLLLDASSGGFVITFPLASEGSYKYTLRFVDITNTITFATTGADTADAITPKLNTTYVVQSDGISNWFTEIPVVSEGTTLAVSKRAYVANYGNGVTQEIDTDTNLILRSFGAASLPRANEINPYNGILYTGQYSLANVLLNDVTDPAAPLIATIPVGGNPRIIETRPGGLEVRVVNNASNSISVIDADPSSPTNNTVINTITGISTNPRGLKFDANGDFAYVTCIGGGQTYKVDANAKTASLLVTLGDSPHGIEISNDGSKFYASGFSAGTLYVRTTDTGALIANIPMSSPHGMARKNGKIYVGNYSANTVTVIDQNTDSVITTIAGIPLPYSLDEDLNNEQVYVTGATNDQLLVIDTIEDKVVRAIEIQTASRHVTVA